VTPEASPAIAALYGSDGTCWTESDDQRRACEAACQSGLRGTTNSKESRHLHESGKSIRCMSAKASSCGGRNGDRVAPSAKCSGLEAVEASGVQEAAAAGRHAGPGLHEIREQVHEW
jgi:hypothetical protein